MDRISSSDNTITLTRWLAERVVELAELPVLQAERGVLLDIAWHAFEPLRVAMIGDVSTGKSALVNALLGRHDADVRLEEATGLVTWFRQPGAPSLPLEAGHESKPAGGPLSDVITLVDTPGVNTVSGNQESTEAMLRAGTTVAGSVSAIVYLVECTKGLDIPGVSRLRRFSTLTASPFDCHAGIVLAGSKADGYDPRGSLGAGSPEARAELVQDLLDSAEDIAPGLVEYAVAVMPTLAEASRTDVLTDELVDQIVALGANPVLRDAIPNGWDFLEGKANGLEPPFALDRVGLGRLFGSWVGLGYAAHFMAREQYRDPAGALRTFLAELSGLAELEERLRYLASIGGVLTTSAVTRRLKRLAAHLGPDRSKPVEGILVDCRRHPAMADYEREAAAIVLDGPTMRNMLSIEDRAEGAALLRAGGHGLSGPARERWRKASQPGRPQSHRHVAQLVLELSRPSTGDR